MSIILVAKNKILVLMDTCNHKPCSHFRQVAKNNQLQKTPRGMYSHTSSCISFTITGIFHPLISHRTMQQHIQLHKILGSIF
jgi:hypothetical protein